MAMRIGSDDDAVPETHDINVTPFIDVMLVLLIIFMVAAPLATTDIRIDLPAASSAPQPRPDKPIFLTVKADHTLNLGDAPVAREALVATLEGLTGVDRETRIFLRADRSVDYETLMSVMDALETAGYLKIALIAEAKPGIP